MVGYGKLDIFVLQCVYVRYQVYCYDIWCEGLVWCYDFYMGVGFCNYFGCLQGWVIFSIVIDENFVFRFNVVGQNVLGRYDEIIVVVEDICVW